MVITIFSIGVGVVLILVLALYIYANKHRHEKRASLIDRSLMNQELQPTVSCVCLRCVVFIRVPVEGISEMELHQNARIAYE